MHYKEDRMINKHRILVDSFGVIKLLQRGWSFLIVVALLVVSMIRSTALAEEPLAFPGAEGFGRFTIGGRGGVVLHVTDLGDNAEGQFYAASGAPVDGYAAAAYGEGTLRWALETVAGPRYVVFDIGGVADLTSGFIRIENPFVTIAGQTAPGEGITTRLARLRATTNDIIMRGMRLRPDDEYELPDGSTVGDAPYERDSFSMGKYGDWSATYNIILDHNSMSWALDEVCTALYGANNITISYNIIAEALDDNIHVDEGQGSPAPHGFLVLFSEGADRITLAKNLLSTAQSRFPQFTRDVTNIEVINNFCYNWESSAMVSSSGTGYTKTANVRNNFYKPGYESLNRPPVYIKTADSNSGIFMSGNLDDAFRPTDLHDEYDIAHGPNNGPVPSYMKSTVPKFEASGVNVLSVDSAIQDVVDNAGALLPVRDSVDARIVDNAATALPGENAGHGKGLIVDKPEDVGGYYWYPTVFRDESFDSDRDGMPDDWEVAKGLDPLSFNAIGNELDPVYDNIEVYINGLIDDTILAPSPNPDSDPDPDPTPDPDPVPDGLSVAFGPVDDAFVRGGSKEDNNYGDDEDLTIKTPSSTPGSYHRRAFLKFDLSELLDAGYSQVGSASIRLFANRKDSVGSLVPVSLFEVSDDTWSEENIDWDGDHPAPMDGARIGTDAIQVTGVGQWYTHDITSYVNGELGAGDGLVSIMLKDLSEASNRVEFDSKEGEFAPALEISISGDPGSDSVPDPDPTPDPDPVPDPDPTPDPDPAPTPDGSFEPVADAYVRGGSKADINYGDHEDLRVKDASSESNDRRSYLRFDLGAISGKDVSEAKLWLYVNRKDSSSSPVPNKIFSAANDSWIETGQNGITWANAPAIGSALDEQVITGTKVWYSFDVTSFVASEVSGDAQVTLVLMDTTHEENRVEYDSREAENRPVLEVIYTD